MAEIVDWRQAPLRRRLFFLTLAVLLAVIFGSRTALSYYVEALWFGSLGYEGVFRKTLTLQWSVFLAFSAVTFLILYGWFLALRRVYARDLPSGTYWVPSGEMRASPVSELMRPVRMA